MGPLQGFLHWLLLEAMPEQVLFYVVLGGVLLMCYGGIRLALDVKAGFKRIFAGKPNLQGGQILQEKVKMDQIFEDDVKNVLIQGPVTYRPMGLQAMTSSSNPRYHVLATGDWGAVHV